MTSKALRLIGCDIKKIFDMLKYNSSLGTVLARGALGAFVLVGIVDP
jgi:hypothetical protein